MSGRVPPRGARLHQLVVRDLIERIGGGELAPGALLPTEPELCQLFEVSRSVVRDAVRVLAEKGLVDVRPGRGTTVRPVDDTLAEGTETVSLTVGAGTGYAVGSPASASGSIADNDVAKVSVANATVTEGNTGTTTLNVAVTLSNPSTQTITVVATRTWSSSAK